MSKQDLHGSVNLEYYRVFCSVCECGGITAAAEALCISQPAVSQAVRQLETALGCRLFLRTSRGVKLTSEGELLLSYVRRGIDAIQDGETMLRRMKDLETGEIRIGASDTICRYYLVPFLSEFHKRYPNIHIKVTNRTSIECARLLDNGQVDFILTNYPNSGLGGTQNIHVLREFNDIFVANETYFPMKDRPVTLRELQALPILMLDRKSTTSEFLHNMFQKHQLDLVPEIELSSNDLLIDLARIGLGIAFVPDFCLPAGEKELYALTLTEALPPRQLVVVHNETMPISQASREFIELLENGSKTPEAPAPEMKD